MGVLHIFYLSGDSLRNLKIWIFLENDYVSLKGEGEAQRSNLSKVTTAHSGTKRPSSQTYLSAASGVLCPAVDYYLLLL